VEEVLARWGRIDAVVNHTGHPPKGDLLAISAEDWQRGHDMVLAPVIEMARLVTPTMLKQGTGAFVNITTFAAYEPSLIFPVSCTYRAAVGAFTRLYADRYAAQGLRMNAVLPGFTDSLNHKPETVASIPMKRVAAVSEIAKSVAFLLSEDASYITGQSLRVDGGITRGL
jgi:NAD(P)-dependent dehydrogenase (short-subunit alcohol dehydrogenase family)